MVQHGMYGVKPRRPNCAHKITDDAVIFIQYSYEPDHIISVDNIWQVTQSRKNSLYADPIMINTRVSIRECFKSQPKLPSNKMMLEVCQNSKQIHNVFLLTLIAKESSQRKPKKIYKGFKINNKNNVARELKNTTVHYHVRHNKKK